MLDTEKLFRVSSLASLVNIPTGKVTALLVECTTGLMTNRLWSDCVDNVICSIPHNDTLVADCWFASAQL